MRAGVQGAVERGAGRGGEDGGGPERGAAGPLPARGARRSLSTASLSPATFSPSLHCVQHCTGGPGSADAVYLAEHAARRLPVLHAPCWTSCLSATQLHVTEPGVFAAACADRYPEGVPQRARGAVPGRVHAPGLHHAHHRAHGRQRAGPHPQRPARLARQVRALCRSSHPACPEQKCWLCPAHAHASSLCPLVHFIMP